MASDAATDLTCYLHEGWAPRIRPAVPARDWMDETPERFAYRCLPLTMANGLGWEIGSPCAFAVRWDGGTGTGAVTIEADPASEPHRRPVSLFGEGTLTFHVEGLLRTSPGWNLWVGGPANMAKDGIAPLGGLIETDWSPYTFTMNWRFTRPGHWVRWDEDEPFCCFFPVQRGTVESITPRFRPLEDDPALAASFARWSESRNAFQDHVEKHQPSAPAERWQKLYYRGMTPDGVRGTPDHQTRSRSCPFQAADVEGERQGGIEPWPSPRPAAR